LPGVPRHGLLALLLSAIAWAFPVGATAGTERPPNVLFLIVDDLRPELGAYGATAIQTPRIDELAASGVRFTRAYAQQAFCNPSRTSVLTGLRPDTTRVWNASAYFRDVLPEAVTLPAHFRRHGYRAVAFGKVFHVFDPSSWSEPTRLPDMRNTWTERSRLELERARKLLRSRGAHEETLARLRPRATEDDDVPDSLRPDGELANLAIQALQELSRADEPFFLAVGFIRPHLPFTPPRRYWDLYDRNALEIAGEATAPRGSPSMAMNTLYELRDYVDFAASPRPKDRPLPEARQRLLKHGYYASVSFVDTQVGRVLDALERTGRADETIVVLWGDHGFKLGELGSWCKQTNYEIDTRVPLIVRAPGARKGGVSPGFVELLDLYPTLSELAGLPLREELEGRSFATLLTDPSRPGKPYALSQHRRRESGQEYMGYAIRTDRYRYVEWIRSDTAATAARELYDHQDDPGESRNLAGEPGHEALLERLSGDLFASQPRPRPDPSRAGRTP
jgi:iduronate 2-sulfatase